MECLDDATVADFVEGRLTREAEGTVHAHIDTCAKCRKLVAHATRAFLTDTVPENENENEPGDPKPVLERDAEVGHYRVRGVVGAGAMGIVYEAYDPRLDRSVALKILLDDHGETARLRAEAQALAKVSHPNVVTVHDVGTIEGRVFIAMELVEGLTAAQWLRAAPRTVAEVLAVFRAAGRGLAAAHRAGLILRDFKPDNVLVGFDGRVRVTDFGLAVSSAVVAPDAPRPRAIVAGTPMYMAPEQRLGAATDARSDQYTFAVVVGESLHGVHPTLGRSTGAAAAKGRVPRRVARALARAVSDDPEKRFPSMDALLSALDPVASWKSLALTASVVLLVALVGSYIAVMRRARGHSEETATVALASVTSMASVSADPVPSAREPAAPRPSSIASAARPGTVHRPSPPATGAKVDCDPDFWLDADGAKHFKPECFGSRLHR
jgi:serine/threonine protein kinase